MYVLRDRNILLFSFFKGRQARSPPSLAPHRLLAQYSLRRSLRIARFFPEKYTKQHQINLSICSDGCWRTRFSHLVAVLFSCKRSRWHVMQQYLRLNIEFGRFLTAFDLQVKFVLKHPTVSRHWFLLLSFVNLFKAKIITFCPCMGRYGNQLGPGLRKSNFRVQK